MKVKAHHLVEILALAAVVAAMLVPGAAASGQRPDDRAGVRGPGAISAHVVTRPDDRGGLHGAGQVSASQAAAVTLNPDGGFEWDAVALGAAGTLVLVLLLAGTTLGARRLRQLSTP